MPGERRPMDVNLAVVDGGKHWTKDEIQRRKDSEVKLPKPKSLTPPSWLSDPAKKLFRAYAKQLLDFPSGIVSKLDTGTLARYCDCEYSYAEASTHKTVWLGECARLRLAAGPGGLADLAGDAAYDAAQEQVDYWASQMVKFEKICRSCATEMGMTVSSRCRLVVPEVKPVPGADPLEALRQKFLNG